MNRNWKGMPAALAAGLLGGVLTASASDVSGGAAARPASAPAPAAAAMTAADIEAFLDGIVPTQLAREDIAGAVVVVVKDGKVLFGKGYGFADVEKRKPVSVDDTLFRPGSTSKLFTWTAVMQQVEQGKLDLDKDVNAYIDFKIPEAFGKPITLRDIMTHTPGYEDYVNDLFTTDPKSVQPLGKHVATHQPHRICPPGATPAYSNYATALAGYIVERVSGKPFEAYIEEFITRPLGMAHATFRQPLPPDLEPLMSKGYRLGSGKAEKYELVNPSPAGAMAASGGAMARFMIAHLQDGRYENVQILKPETAQLMHARQRGHSPDMSAMCLGFYEESRNGHRIIGHGGDTQWFHSDLHLVPDAGLGFFVSYNSAGKGEISGRTMLWESFLDRYFPYEPPAASPVPSAAADIRAVSGSLPSQPARRLELLPPPLSLLAAEGLSRGGGHDRDRRLQELQRKAEALRADRTDVVSRGPRPGPRRVRARPSGADRARHELSLLRLQPAFRPFQPELPEAPGDLRARRARPRPDPLADRGARAAPLRQAARLPAGGAQETATSTGTSTRSCGVPVVGRSPCTRSPPQARSGSASRSGRCRSRGSPRW